MKAWTLLTPGGFTSTECTKWCPQTSWCSIFFGIYHHIQNQTRELCLCFKTVLWLSTNASHYFAVLQWQAFFPEWKIDESYMEMQFLCLFVCFSESDRYFFSIHSLICSADLYKKQIQDFRVLLFASRITFYRPAVTYYKIGKQVPNKADKSTDFSWRPADLARPLTFFFLYCMPKNHDSYQIHVAPKRIILILAKAK